MSATTKRSGAARGRRFRLLLARWMRWHLYGMCVGRGLLPSTSFDELIYAGYFPKAESTTTPHSFFDSASLFLKAPKRLDCVGYIYEAFTKIQ